MKKSITLIIAALFSFTVLSAATNSTLTISVSNIDPVDGKLWVALCNSEDSYKKGKMPFKRTKVAVTRAQQSITFIDLPAGEYAVKIIHDENDNGKFDTNIIGIPKEGFGFSNNSKGKMGPPSFSKAKFTIDSNKKIYIKIMKI